MSGGASPDRFALALLSALVASPVAAGEPETTCGQDEACIDRLIAQPPALTRARLPTGYRIGRCLLRIDGRTLIRGACAYKLSNDGSFYLTGAHQVFDGIDYVAQGMAGSISTDWWANVFAEDGGWTGYSNGDEEIGSVHGQASRWGRLVRHGACFANRKGGAVLQQVRICLWKQ